MKNSIKTLAMWLIIIIIFIVLITSILDNSSNKFTYSELISKIESGEVKELEISSDGTKAEVTLKNENNKKEVNIPSIDSLMDSLQDSMKTESIIVSEKSESIFMIGLSLLTPFGILIIFLVFWFFLMGGNQANGGNKTMTFGKSKARMLSPQDKARVTFKDVAGVDEEKEELEEIVEFLKNPKKFTDMGARIPKGVLLVGPPGTGKTLLAKAVAGEANVPFFYISGSDFVELFVGVGASRVRDMFKEAKRCAPCLIFIDEIDAVGRQRGSGIGGGHDEREQTLNQLLTEMDGFGANEGIIIIAATNRPDVLDPALLRPGRFDRQVTVSLPDSKAREEILKVHAKNKIFDKNINLKNVAQRTPGYSGADLENLLNEAALLAVRRNKNAIGMPEIDEATDRVLMGPAKTSRVITPAEKRLVAIHEAGHAVLGIKLENAQEVHKITIIPRGMAGGYTMMLPKEEKIAIMTKNELLAHITGLLGGRASEELFLGEITTGASDDFKKATNVARSMVTEYGMSDLGPMQYEQQSGENVFLGRDYNKSKNYSDQVALEIDQASRKIIEECYEKAKKVLKENEDLVNLLADALITNETLTKEQIESLVLYGKICDTEECPSTSEPTLLKLREMAKAKKIKGYTKMTKEELLEALKDEIE